MLTGLKFPILVLSVPPLSSGTTAARLAFLGKFEVRILLFIASVTGLNRALLAIFTNLGGIRSSPVWIYALEDTFYFFFLHFVEME